MTRIGPVAIIGVTILVIIVAGLQGQPQSKGGPKMKQFAPHPGTIRMIDESDGSVRTVKADDVPERRRFVYLNKDGVEVDSAEEAVERIPIVEVRMTPTDGKGNLVAKDHAQLIRIKEFGPGNRLLRSTTMTPTKPQIRR
jgi:hypothetical protein